MSDIGLFNSIGYIAWLVAGLVLCAAETIAPGAFLIWIGAAALISAAPGSGGAPIRQRIEVRQVMSGPPEEFL